MLIQRTVEQMEKGFCWWKNVPATMVSPMRFNEIMDELEADKSIRRLPYTVISIRFIKIVNRWSMGWNENDTSHKLIRVCKAREDLDKSDDIFNFEVYQYEWSEHEVIPSKEDVQRKRNPSEYFSIVNKLFTQKGGGCKTMGATFSGVKYKEIYTAMKECVPPQVAYMCQDDDVCGKILEHVYKADISSAYPSQMLRSLPTLREGNKDAYKRIEGTAEPTEEFPFAFYLKSHHIKTFDGYNSHELKDNPFYSKKDYLKHYNDKVKPQDDITILCKAMKPKHQKALADTYQYLYDHRKEDPDNKAAMNQSIGYCQRGGNPTLSFIPAIVQLRNNIDMLRKCEQLMNEGNKIIFIATDCIAWVGKPSDIATDEKYLGSFTYEGKDIKFLGFSQKKYQWESEDGVCTTKNSGMKKENSAKLKFGELSRVAHKDELPVKYMYNKKLERFEESVLI